VCGHPARGVGSSCFEAERRWVVRTREGGRGQARAGAGGQGVSRPRLGPRGPARAQGRAAKRLGAGEGRRRARAGGTRGKRRWPGPGRGEGPAWAAARMGAQRMSGATQSRGWGRGAAGARVRQAPPPRLQHVGAGAGAGGGAGRVLGRCCRGIGFGGKYERIENELKLTNGPGGQGRAARLGGRSEGGPARRKGGERVWRQSGDGAVLSRATGLFMWGMWYRRGWSHACPG
jgi:hypothetical protein